jgi:hypothetical protein
MRSPATIVSGQSATGTVSLTSPAGSGGAFISLSSSNSTVASIPSSVTVSQGASSVTYSVTVGTVTASTPVILIATYSGVSKTAALSVNPPTPN